MGGENRNELGGSISCVRGGKVERPEESIRIIVVLACHRRQIDHDDQQPTTLDERRRNRITQLPPLRQSTTIKSPRRIIWAPGGRSDWKETHAMVNQYIANSAPSCEESGRRSFPLLGYWLHRCRKLVRNQYSSHEGEKSLPRGRVSCLLSPCPVEGKRRRPQHRRPASLAPIYNNTTTAPSPRPHQSCPKASAYAAPYAAIAIGSRPSPPRPRIPISCYPAPATSPSWSGVSPTRAPARTIRTATPNARSGDTRTS